MVDENKIMLMVKMAHYEKNHIKQDKKVTEYFIEDYIYINNFKTRLGITLITLCFIGLGALKMLMKDIIFPTSMWHFIEVYIRPYFYPWLFGIILYTIISSILYGRRYKIASKRFEEYRKLVKDFKRYKRRHSNDEEATNET